MPYISASAYPIVSTALQPQAYKLFAALGFLAAFSLLAYNVYRDKTLGVNRYDLYLIFGAAFILGAASANIGNWFNFPELWHMPLIQRIESAGFTFYAGAIGFFLTAALMLRLFRQPVRYCINLAVPSLLLFHCIGRIGCSLAGCCYGIEGDYHILGLHLSRFPARELESLCLLAFAVIAQFCFRHNYVRFLFYSIAYPVARFFIEFGRGDNRGALIVDFISPAQVISLLILLGVLIYAAARLIRRKIAPPGPPDSTAAEGNDIAPSGDM